ncbi:MAG: hypothetical protein ACPGJE_02495 [Wenzhouxiangellaceae bacterium]
MRISAPSTAGLTRTALAIPGGALLGIILQEAVWNLLNALVWDTDLYQALLIGPTSEGLLWALAVSWSAGGITAGLMSTLIAGHRAAGYISGALLSGAAVLLIALAWPATGAVLLLALTPVLAAMVGAWAGQPLVVADRARVKNSTLATLAAHGLD